MEFYELIEMITNAVPDGYENVRLIMEAALPWVLGVCCAATCFFGHTVHKIWNYFFFFWIGFLVPVFLLGLIFDASGDRMYALIAVGAITGVACSYYSKKLFKLQLFVTAFLMVFISLPSYLAFMGKAASVAVSLALGAAAGILSTKYKYIATIVTTAFSGAFMLFGVLEPTLGIPHAAAAVLSVALGAAGLSLQCFIERRELKESWEELKEKKNKLKNRKKPEPGGVCPEARKNTEENS